MHNMDIDNKPYSGVTRRGFLRNLGLSGAAFIIGIKSASAFDCDLVANLSEEDVLMGQSFNLSPFIIIDTSGQIILCNTKPEMGQGTYQSIPALIAEELELRQDQFKIYQTGGESKFGRGQSAGGSFSVRMSYMELRKVGAAAKEMLIKAAAQKWGVAEESCYAKEANIFNRSNGKSFSYGELVADASKLEIPSNPVLKDAKDFNLLGKSVQRQDIPMKVNGTAVFGIDADVPGMLFASVERCPVFGAKLVRFDKSAALKIHGVEQVIEVERVFGKYKTTGIAVIASNYWAALKARKVLNVQWDYQGNEQFSSQAFAQKMINLSSKEGAIDKNIGDFEKVYQESTNQLEAFYRTPFVSHSPMEAMNCTVNWKADNTLEIWTSTQVPSDIMDDLPARFGLKPQDITLNTCFNGGGFGRRLAIDFIIEAVNLGKTLKKPVKLIWTREDDTQLGPYRPPTYSSLKGALSADGKLVAFHHKVISPSILAFLDPNFDGSKVDETMVEGISHQAYEIPNMKNSWVYADIHVPLLWWRSVTSSTLAFAHECFIDELATKAGTDPLDFRLDMLSKEGDAKRVLTKLREVSNWDAPLENGKGRGVAQWEFFAGLAAQVIEVTKTSANTVKIDKVYVVIDLGIVVNPDTVRAQMEGAVVMGITAATKGGITFEEGVASQSNFHNNPILRINEIPPIEVHILTEGGTVKGVGEPGLPPVAPALANAIFSATGIRLRSLPFDINNLNS